jgi:hypothetical protein
LGDEIVVVILDAQFDKKNLFTESRVNYLIGATNK